MNKLFQVLNIVGFVGMVGANYLAVALPLNGQTPGEISDRYPTLFTPAGFTFSIWSVIYLLLLVFSVRQAKNLLKADIPAPAFVGAIGPWFFVGSVANATWLFAWHHEQFLLALAIMLALLATLVQIYVRLGIGRASASKLDRFSFHLPFSVYLGWITVATIANVSVLLVSTDWSGWGIAPGTWAILMMAAGTFIGLNVIRTRRDTAFGLVLAWAFFGIWSARRMDAAEVAPVSVAALAAMIVMLFAAVFSSWKKWKAQH